MTSIYLNSVVEYIKKRIYDALYSSNYTTSYFLDETSRFAILVSTYQAASYIFMQISALQSSPPMFRAIEHSTTTFKILKCKKKTAQLANSYILNTYF